MPEGFILRALAAGIGLAIIAAPLGCLVVWRRMSYFGSTIAHSGLLGVAVGIALGLSDLTLPVIVVSLLIALALAALQRQRILPTDALLGLLSHTALAMGLVAAALLKGQRLDLMGYLFGDILAVTTLDLVWTFAGGAIVLVVVAILWRALIAVSVHEELARAEGLDTHRAELVLMILLAFVVAVAMKIVGILLVIAFLVMPAVAARPFSSTPERMVVISGLVGVFGTMGGLVLSLASDVPAGPAIVLVLALVAALALSRAMVQRGS